ncbi:MAG TPA: hypothetical protein PKL57_06805 [Candidatus Wallbacteria bacterium]|nr:hypothetical protein [Candidatus Wallbacteria bacterium]
MLARHYKLNSSVFIISLVFFTAAFSFEACAQKIIGAQDFVYGYKDKTHSMADSRGYAQIKTLKRVVEGVAGGEYSDLFIVEGGETEAVKFLAGSGARNITKKISQNSRGEKWDFFEFEINGKKSAAEYHVFGEDMLRHIMLCYSFAGTPAGRLKGVLRENCLYEIFSGFYKSLKLLGPADYGINGYRRAVVRHIYWRINAARKAESLKSFVAASGGAAAAARRLKTEWLAAAGVKAYRKNFIRLRQTISFMSRIETEAECGRFFKNSKNYYELDAFEKNILFFDELIVKKNKCGLFSNLLRGGSIKFSELEGLAGEYFNDLEFDIRRIAFKDSYGREKKILVCEHPYGANSAAMASTMAKSGIKKIIFYGTCGFLLPARKYSVIIPGQIMHGAACKSYSAAGVNRSPLYAFQNSIYAKVRDKFKASPEICGGEGAGTAAGIILTKKHRSIFSPLAETMEFIAGCRESGIESVDVEAGCVFGAPDTEKIEKSAVFIASDFPGTRSTLENWERESGDYIRAQMKVLDIIIEELDIKEIVLKQRGL